MRIVVLGCGYVGLTTACCLASLGHEVVGLDVDSDRIRRLKNGNTPVYEPGLEELLEEALESSRIRFVTDVEEILQPADIWMIAVGTPTDEHGHSDLSQVELAADQIAEVVSEDSVVVMRSTVPVGTSARIAKRLAERLGTTIPVASNPEFLQQGSAIANFMEPDRIIVGASDDRAHRALSTLYGPITAKGAPLLHVDLASAEMIKYAANAFLAVRLSLVNEIADLCEAVGADIETVTAGVGLDARIGSAFLRAGPGFGGSCLPKDLQALRRTAQLHGSGSVVLSAALQVNQARRHSMATRVLRALENAPHQAEVCILGLTFKAGTDDLRESPAIDLARDLIGRGFTIRAYDPMAGHTAKPILPTADLCATPYEAAIGADAVVIATEWPEFEGLDLGRIGQLMRSKVIVDLRNLIDSKAALDAGFSYHGIGRPRPQRSVAEL